MVSLFKNQCHRHFFSNATSYCCVCHQHLCERCSHFSEKHQTHFCQNHFNHLKTHHWLSVFCFKSSPENAEFGVFLFEKQKTLFLKKKISYKDLCDNLLRIVNLKKFKKFKKIQPRNIDQIINLSTYINTNFDNLMYKKS